MARCLARRIVILCAWIVLGGLLAITGSGVRAADDQIPEVDRQQIIELLKQKVSDLVSQKNQEGLGYMRGSFSRSLRRVDDGTAQVAFHRDTADKETLKTERLLLTFKKESGKWSISKEEVQDTYEGLRRGALGDEEFHRFDKFIFDREGLKVTASNGSLYLKFFMGKPSEFVLVADDLAYEYSPPQDAGYYHKLYRKALLTKDREKDFVFHPDRVVVRCDADSCEQILSSSLTGLRKVAQAEAQAKLQKIYEENRKETEKNLKENPFLGFRLPWPEDREGWAVSIKRAGGLEEHWITLDYDSYEAREVNLFASGYGTVYSYNSEATRKSGMKPYDLEVRDDANARDYELTTLEGTVEIGLEDPDLLKADVTYGVALKRDLRELGFFISRVTQPGEEKKEVKNPKMFVDSIQDGDGNELTWVKTGAFSGVIVFPKVMPAASKLKLRMQFANRDSIYRLNPSYAYLDRGGWLPLVKFGDMIHPLELTVKVPDKYQVLGIGRKVSESTRDGIRTTRWASDSPVTFPTVIFGDYISDEPSFKATKKDGTEIPVRIYVDKESTAYGGRGSMDIRGKQLKALAEQAANALNLYRAIFDMDYPYAKLDLVNAPFQPGAQAPSSIIYLGSFLFRGEGTLATAMPGQISSTYIAKFLKDTVAHETAHQWWGSLIGPRNFRNYWWVESLAEYSSALFVENVYGRKKYLEKVADWRRNILEEEILTPVQDGYTMWAGENDFRAVIANIYNKGPYAFHVLRETFGDEKFFNFLKLLAHELSHKEIVTRDIQRVAEKAFGGNMDWFFDQWFRGVGLPQYALSYTTRKTEDGKWLVEGKIKQRVVAGTDKVELPGVFFRGLGYLTFVSPGGKESKTPKPLLVEGAETPFRLKLADEPVEVYFNKDGEILAQDTLVNRSW